MPKKIYLNIQIIEESQIGEEVLLQERQLCKDFDEAQSILDDMFTAHP